MNESTWLGLLDKGEENARKCKEFLADIRRRKSGLAAEAPTGEPLPWPGCKGEPEAEQVEKYLWRIDQAWGGVDQEYHAWGTTRAETVAAWNRAVRAMSGEADRETWKVIDMAWRAAVTNELIVLEHHAGDWLEAHPEPLP